MCAYAVYSTYLSSGVVIALGIIALVSSLLEIFIDATFPPERQNLEHLHDDTPVASTHNVDIEMQDVRPQYTLTVSGTQYPHTVRRAMSATNLSTMFNTS